MEEELVEDLLGKNCYIVDILPARVPDERIGKYIEVEDFYLQPAELRRIAEKFSNILIKLHCYRDFIIYHEKWYTHMGMVELARLVQQVLESKDDYINLLCKEEKMLIVVSGGTLHMSVYNPELGAIADLSMLATAEGLFLRCAEQPAVKRAIK